MRHFVPLILLLSVSGCGKYVEPPKPKTAVFAFLLPKSSLPWREEMQRGFEDGAKQFQLDYVIRDYTNTNANGIIEAAESLPDLHDGNVCIAFTSTAPIKETVRTLRDKGINAITVGEDEVLSGRIAHCGESSTDLAYRISIRLSQMRPPAKRVLAIIGDEPVHRNGIKGSLFARSENWKRFELRARAASQALSAEDLTWADTIVAVGSKAVEIAVRSTARVIPVDGSEATIRGIRTGRYSFALVPDYYQIGYRCVRISREHFVQGSILNPVLSIPYKEIDKPSLEWFLKKRYELPPVVPAKKG